MPPLRIDTLPLSYRGNIFIITSIKIHHQSKDLLYALLYQHFMEHVDSDIIFNDYNDDDNKMGLVYYGIMVFMLDGDDAGDLCIMD